MAAETLLSLAVSLDGYLADPEGGVAWLDDYMSDEIDFAGFFESVGTVLMGRRTYDQAASFDQWPYGGLRSVVLSHRPFTPEKLGVEVRNEDLGAVIAELRSASQGWIWIMGGAAVMQEALRRNLVDALELNWIPVLLGRGIPLFGELHGLQAWRLVEHQAYGNGILRGRYLRR
jgi:dihydrofolate reductase